MWVEFLFAAFIMPLLIKSQTPSVMLTHITPIEVVNGGVVCPNLYPVELTCVGIDVSFLRWERNGTMIGTFTGLDSKGGILRRDPFTIFLDSITNVGGRANMTSRLVGNVSNLISGNRITCADIGDENAVTLSYRLKESPPIVPTNFSGSSIDTDSRTVNVSITWDSTFNIVHNVTSYGVVVSRGESAASCPSSCDPSGPCQCTGFRVGENTTITMSAINCGDQVGPPLSITVTPRVPSRPSECNTTAVYSSAGDLNAVDVTWTEVSIPNPSEFLPGISQDVRLYYIVVDTRDSKSIPVNTACSTSTSLCSYTYPLQSSRLPTSPFSVSVSAQNVVGRGQMCTPQTEIDIRNQMFSLILDTTNTPGSQFVVCTQVSEEVETFECEFCYSVGDSCQNLTTCISVNGTPTLLPNLTELTYCYRATASINDVAVAVIQDTFNTACPLDVLGTAIDKQTNSRCSSDTLRSISIPNGVGCVSGDTRGSLTTYQCDKWYRLSGASRQTCMSDGNWDGGVPECGRNSVVITLLVLSILVWIVSAILTVIGVIFALVTKEVSLKHRNLFKFQFLLRWMKITYVVLLVIEFPFLLIVFVFWIAFSVILDNPNSESQQTSLLIAAFILALLALLWIIVALIFLCVATKCSSDKSIHQAGVQDVTKSDPNTSKGHSTPVYAVPDKSKKKRPPEEESEHKPGPDNNPNKSKGVKVNKKVKAKKEPLEDIELITQRPAYDKFEGPGHHLSKPIPTSPVIAKNYDVLDVKGQRNGNDHTSGSQGTYSIPGEAEREYSEVDKRSSQKRLLA